MANKILLFLVLHILWSCSERVSEDLSVTQDTADIQEINIDLDKAPVLVSQTKKKSKIEDGRYQPGEILLATNWGQGAPFNNALPEIGNNRTVVGCTNTALVQLLNYYHKVLKTKGIVSHRWNNDETLYANFEKSFRFDLIPDLINSDTPKHLIDELAQVTRDIAIGNRTDFDLAENGGSSASLDREFLQKNLGLSNYTTITKSAEVVNSNFDRIIQNEIAAKRPVLVSFNGSLNHTAVIDGYKIENDRPLYHINLGWNGRENNFYSLDKQIKIKVSQSGNTITYGLSNQFTIYYGIRPLDQEFNSLEADDQKTGPALIGKLTAMDEDLFENIYLKGVVRISKDVSKGYFVEIINSKGEIVKSGAQNISVTLPLGLYTLRVAKFIKLESGQTRFYDGEDTYRVSIQNDTITAADQEIANQIEDFAFVNLPSNVILNQNLLRETIRLEAHVIPAKKAIFHASLDLDSGMSVEIDDHFLHLIKQSELKNGVYELKVGFSLEGSEEVLHEVTISIAIVEKSFIYENQATLVGKFLNRNSVIKHLVVLDGTCSIRGYNGFSNQAFFISLANSDESQVVVPPKDSQISSNFDFGIYQIRSSLSSGNSSYQYQAGVSDSFSVSISCPELQVNSEKLIELTE